MEIYFEKENIWTLDSKGELLITIMSSLAQEESRSISENCTWGQRKRFADGKVTVPFKRFLGYDRGPDGNLVLNKDEAVIIRRIYSMFLQGMTPHGIAARLTADGIKSPGGKDKWNAGAVRSILTNEKYKGDALLQKSYTVDFLTKKKKVNEGEIPQYYVEGNHEAIISPEVFEMVQQEMERRKTSAVDEAVYTFSPAKYAVANAEAGTAPKPGTPMISTKRSSGSAITNLMATTNAPHHTLQMKISTATLFRQSTSFLPRRIPSSHP